MTLIVTLLAAVITTIVWYTKLPDNTYRIGVLALTYWAAALMWCVDGFAGLIEGEGFIELSDKAAMLDDAQITIRTCGMDKTIRAEYDGAGFVNVEQLAEEGDHEALTWPTSRTFRAIPSRRSRPA